ncbi:SusC/RagA family TonB-linked outer membrane protein [Belliella marina]|uniref:SusC/RagA family TonB-linked outer membrane protein n=1 Tax=Belliella marina TaxID=1644146 RepID=A0ABW4VKG2_9BACT
MKIYKHIHYIAKFKKLNAALIAIFVLVNVTIGIGQSVGPRIAVELDSTDQIDYKNHNSESNDQPLNIGYGVQAQSHFTGSMATVSGEALQKTFVPTLSNTLFGRLAGLTIMHGSGEPGFDEPSMLIRGLGTLNNATPLVIVDGFEASFDQLSAFEIESVSILKDAASLAIYGVRGANGVILVTTKRGHDGKTRIRFDARTGFQQPTRLPEFVNASQYASLYNEALSNDGLPLRYSADQIAAYQSGSDPYLYPNVNWYDEVLKNSAPIKDYNLTFSGGNKRTRYFILMGYLQNEGLYSNTDSRREDNSNAHFERVNFRSNIDVAISDKVAASLDFGGRIENRFFPNVNGAQLWENMARYPANAFPVYNPDGSWGGSNAYPNNPAAAVLGRGYTSSHDRNLMANLRLSQNLSDFVPGLKFSQAIGINNYHRANYNRTRNLAFFELIPGSEEGTYSYLQRGLDSGFSISEWGNDQWNRLNLQFALDYQKQLNDHGLQAMMMYHQDAFYVGGNNVPYANQSVMGRFSYNYLEKYFAELTMAYSGSERFPEGNRFGLFPAVSAGWILSKEDFMSQQKVFDYLKVRGSVGLVGSDKFGGSRFAYAQDFYYSGDYRLGAENTSNGIIMEGSLANTNISWEKDFKTNFGFQGQVLGHLDFRFDAFYNSRTDILINGAQIYPGYLGVVAPHLNFGKVNNRGVELELNYSNEIGEFRYHLGGNVSFAKNKIIAMQEIDYPESYMQRTGHPIGQPFGWVADGFYMPEDFQPDGSLVSGVVNSSFGPVQPGDIKYKDLNNDGVIDQNDETAIGKPWQPQVNYGINLGGAFKGFDLDLLFYGLAQRDVALNGTYFWALQNDANIPAHALGRWTMDNQQNATYPRLSTLPNENNFRPSTFWQASGNVFRLRNIELGYTLPSTLTQKIRVDSFRLYVNAVNLFTWDSMDMVDPESFGGYPPLKSFNMGVTLQF